MSERAFSIELNKKVKATELSSLFKSGVLKNIKLFECIDRDCRVPLTAKAVNSTKQPAQFIIQNHSQPHISTCFEAGKKEHKDRFLLEKKRVNELLQSQTIQTFAAPLVSDNSKKNSENSFHKVSNTSQKGGQRSSSSNSNSKKEEHKTTRSLDIMVDTFENSIDKSEMFNISFPFEVRQWPDVKSFKIQETRGKKTLNELFCPISEMFPFNKFKIFYGLAYLQETNRTQVSINFIHNNSIHLYTNKQKLLNLPEKETIKKALLDNKPVTVYCQGAIELVHLKDGDEFRIITVTEHIYRSLFFKSHSESLGIL